MANQHKKNRILLASVVATSVVATSAMTVFSYIVSRIKADNYREPLLLADFFEKSAQTKKQTALSLGWIVHYGVGFLFGLIYEPISKKRIDRPPFRKGFCFGLLAGAAAIGGWSVLFRLHADKPKINHQLFFKQLVISHIIFGLVFASLYTRYKKYQNEIIR
ncbi:MAG: hypothetical protein JWQ74_3672 [Marmoricola sp.]|nr:hypothetical protein [Marmoricola sp.]